MMCSKCSAISGVLLLVLGVLFLLKDLAVWDFWGVSWYSALFVLAGVVMLAHRSCPDCQVMMMK